MSTIFERICEVSKDYMSGNVDALEMETRIKQILNDPNNTADDRKGSMAQLAGALYVFQLIP